MQDLAQQFTEDLAEVVWTDLKPHAKRDAIILVHPGLDLVEVATAIANDNVSKVQPWIQEALIQKPSAEQLSTWNLAPTQCFQTLIVQPYVLVMEKTEDRPVSPA